MRIALIALDIDGTLLDPQYCLSQMNRETLERAHDAGIEIVLATGRRYDYALPTAQELHFPVTLITSNGALTRLNSGECIARNLMPRATVLELIGWLGDYRSKLIVTFDHVGEQAMAAETLEEMRRIVPRWIDNNLRGIQLRSPVEELITEDPIQVMYCGSIADIQQVENRLRQNESLWQRLSVSQTKYHDRDLCLLDILTAGCTKGSALAHLCQLRGIGREAVVAVGDNCNDLQMFEFAGRAYVMGNASEAMKALGLPVTRPNTESGVAWAVLDALGETPLVME